MKNYSEGYQDTLNGDKATAGEMSKALRDEAFAKLIKSEYKEQFQNRFNREFGRRFREMKETEEELSGIKEALKPLMDYYRTDDIKLLTRLILREKRELKPDRRNGKYTEKETEFIKKQYENWKSEMAEAKGKYPEFRLESEFKNPLFRAGLRSGIPMTELYRTLHFDELSRSIEEAAAKAAVENIRAGNGRIREVGTENSASVRERKNVNELTDAEIDDFLDRISRGEKITFGA